jgi:D-sedoheptulose 7-phosphate isomerase
VVVIPLFLKGVAAKLTGFLPLPFINKQRSSKMPNFSSTFLSETIKIASLIDTESIEKVATLLSQVRNNNGRLFILGVGGSAASASHAVNDFRKLCNFETYSPIDNVSELTARTNDEGWDTVFEQWLKGSRLKNSDIVLVLSVGGGNVEKNVSVNIVKAITYAKSVGAKVCSIVGKDGGFAAKNSDAFVLIPVIDDTRITPHTESYHGVIWHLLVSHPLLKINPTKW